MERKNSKSKRKNRIRKMAVFLRPDIARLHSCKLQAYGREGDGYKTRKGKKSA